MEAFTSGPLDWICVGAKVAIQSAELNNQSCGERTRIKTGGDRETQINRATKNRRKSREREEAHMLWLFCYVRARYEPTSRFLYSQNHVQDGHLISCPD